MKERTKGTCKLCGHWSSHLKLGACSCCQDAEAPYYIKQLAVRVRDNLHELLELPNHDVLEHIITEAIHQVRLDASSGMHLEIASIATAIKTTNATNQQEIINEL